MKKSAITIHSNTNSRLPLYQQIKEQLRARIISGELKPNELAPSEKEITEQFKVSSITARRCLNDLEQEGYVQRVRGRGTFVRPFDALRLDRRIGVFFNELASLSNTFLNAVVSGIATEGKVCGFELELLSWAPVRGSHFPVDALVELTRQRHLEALIVLSPAPVGWFQGVIKQQIPVISVNFGYEDPAIYSVLTDRAAAIRERSEALAALGHRRVAEIREVFSSQPDVEGVIPTDAFDENLAAELFRVTVPYGDADALDRSISQLLNLPEPPSAFFVIGYEAALQTRRSLEDRGYRIPDDFSLLATAVPPGPTHLFCEHLPARKMGAEAVRMAAGLLKGGQLLSRVVRMVTSISAGRTLGAARESVAWGT